MSRCPQEKEPTTIRMRSELGYWAGALVLGVIAPTCWWAFTRYAPSWIFGSWEAVAELSWGLVELVVGIGCIAVVPAAHTALRVWLTPARRPTELAKSVLVVTLCAPPYAGIVVLLLGWSDSAQWLGLAFVLFSTICAAHVVVGGLRQIPRG